MKRILILLLFFAPVAAFANHNTSSQFKELNSGKTSAFYCNQKMTDSVTYEDGPYRLLYKVDIGGLVEWDDVLTLHQTFKNLATSFTNTWEIGRFFSNDGNTKDSKGCDCNEGGCSGFSGLSWLTKFLDDPYGQTVDSVTITGEALEKLKPAEGASDVGFKGPVVMATWRLCDEKQVTSNGICQIISGNIESDKPGVCVAPCSPKISWSSTFAENVVVKKNGINWQSGSNNSGVVDSGLKAGTYTYSLYGTASDGNNSPKEFFLDSTEVKVSSEPIPSLTCSPASQTVVLNKTVTIIASQGTSFYFWSAPGGIPSTGFESSFSTSYNTTGSKTVTVTSGEQSATCNVDVQPQSQPPSSAGKLDIKANNQDYLEIPNTTNSFTLSWGSNPADAIITNCKSEADFFNMDRPCSGSVQISTGGVSGTKTYKISGKNAIGEIVDDSVIVTITGSASSQESCGLSVNSTSVSPGDRVSFTVSSLPIGYSYYWTGKNNGVEIGQISGTGNTNNIESYTLNSVGEYTRQAHVRLPNKVCDTGTVTVIVEEEGGGGDVSVGVSDLLGQLAVATDGSIDDEGAFHGNWKSLLTATDPDLDNKIVDFKYNFSKSWNNTDFNNYLSPNFQVRNRLDFDCTNDSVIDGFVTEDSNNWNWTQIPIFNLCNYPTPGTYTARATPLMNGNTATVKITVESQPVCPAGSVVLSSNVVSVKGTVTASAPSGFTGGSFSYTPYSSLTMYVSISGSTIIGRKVGTTNIIGSGWSHSNGSTNCPLSGTQLTVTSAPVDGVCGTANKTYPVGSTSYGYDSYCSSGIPSAIPDFPPPGNSVSWFCGGLNGGKNSGNCTASVPALPMSGTLTPSTPSCEIALGDSTCNINFSWITTNPVSISSVTRDPSAGFNSPVQNSGTNVSFPVPYNTATFFLYNNNTELARSTVTSNCVSGTTWDQTNGRCTGVSPAPPSNLQGNNSTCGQIRLTWSDNSNNETGFRIYRSRNQAFSIGGYYATVGANVTSYTDLIPIQSSDNYYMIASYNNYGENYSNVVSITPVSCLVPDFGLNKSRDIFVNIVGTQAVTSNSAKITVAVFDGFSSNVNLSVQSVSPALSGTKFNFSDSSLTPGEFSTGSDFSVTVPASAPPGLYTITVRGIDGGLVRDVNVRLNVNTKDPSFREI